MNNYVKNLVSLHTCLVSYHSSYYYRRFINNFGSRLTNEHAPAAVASGSVDEILEVFRRCETIPQNIFQSCSRTLLILCIYDLIVRISNL